ncbi:MAG: NTP transferase domain-containing protein, partial [Muribaculaceae bacterium]|nr:NTP transferase domain-containing protein [Muribaculaceae bacterium]
MTAMIFAAGLGSRLAPLTDNCPKALLPVAGVPMIERAVTLLRDSAGVDRVVVNIHSHA